MRRLAGSRLGATFTLSVVLVLPLGQMAGIPASGQAVAPTTAAAAAVGSELHRVGAVSARAAAEVELPRPVRGANAVRLLDDQLDEAAALNDMSEAELTELLTTDRSVWLDLDGVVFFKDATAIAPANDPVSAAAPLDQTFALHSRPGSTRTIYLDFDGSDASATAWHASYPATPTTQPAWDLTGNPAVFDDAERTAIQTVWQAVAEDYAPFDVDVTTADPGPTGTNRANAADNTYGSHVLITPSDGAHDAICGGCGGVAYLGVFDTTAGAGGNGYGYRQPAWVFPQKLGNSPKNIAEAVSHEVGHNFGLNHDGNATQGYDTGHGAWAPIMGVGYSRAISQWSKGDYAGANNQEDDVALIRGVAGARADEAPSSIAGAATVPAGTAYVTSRTDVDTYLLGRCTGQVSVTANPLDTLADLDLSLSILDATGQPVASHDPASAQTTSSTASGMGALLDRTLAAGTYYASVDGVGNGPWSTGYDDYGSLGAYTLAATGCDGAAPAGTPSAPTSVAAVPHASDPTATVSWAAPATAGASAVTGYVLTRSGDDTPVQVGGTTTTHTWSGLASSTAYSFTVTALNAQGPGASVTVGATTAAGTAKPSAPQGVTGSWDSLGQRALFGWTPPASSGSSAVSSYDVFVDSVRTYVVGAAGTYVIPMTPGTHTLGVAAVNTQGRGPIVTATVVMPAKAANDAFAQRATLSGVSGSVVGDNLESSGETGEPAPPSIRTGAGAASVWYSWTAPGSGPVTMSTSSSVSGRDTTLAVYTGTSVTALTQVVGNDDVNGASRVSSLQFSATAGTTYAVAVNGYRTFAAGVGQFSLDWAGTPPVASSTTTTLGSVVTGRSATLTAGVSAGSGTPAGQVEFRDGGVLVSTQSLASGSAQVTLGDLVRGAHDFRATFVPGEGSPYATSQSPLVTSTIAATPSTTTLQATGGVQVVDLAADITVAAGTATGTVQFREGQTTVGSATVAGGGAALSLTGVTAGEHTYTAVFVPADTQRYDGSTSASRTVPVSDPVVARATSTSLTVGASGRTATLSATVTASSGTPLGTVQFRDGTTVVGTTTVSGGSASLQVSDLLRGTHRFTAEFVPADASAFTASTSAESTLEIAATPTSTALTASATGRSVGLQATVGPAVAGTVRFLEGTTLLGTVSVSQGAAALTVPDVAAGSHTYTAEFVPADDLRHAPSTSGQQVVTVVATPTTTTLGSAVSDHRVTLTATVTSGAGSPAGTVEFREGSTVLATRAVSTGTSVAVLDDVTTGSHDYTATFVPSSPTSYAASTSAGHTATVVATPTTTGLVATASGRTVTLTATPSAGSGTLAGAVVFREGSTVLGTVPLGADHTVLELTTVAPGAHAYTASYVPSGTRHAGSTSPTRSVTVQATSTTALTATSSGREVTLSVQVSTDGGSPTGVAELREGSTLVGSATLVSGAVSLTIPDVTPGDHSYRATFVPADSASYAGSSSPVRTVTVDIAVVGTTTTLVAGADGAAVALDVTVEAASGPRVPVGAVEISEAGTLIETIGVDANGTAGHRLDGVLGGSHTYTATFVPSEAGWAPSTTDASVVVDQTLTSVVLAPDVQGRQVVLTAAVSAALGTPAGAVSFYDGEVVVGTADVADGTATRTLAGVATGSHAYRAVFTPTRTDRYRDAESAVQTQVVARSSTTTGLTATSTGDRVSFDVRVTSPDGAPEGIVTITEGGTTVVTAVVTGGRATFDHAPVADGSHTYVATFDYTGAGDQFGPSSSPQVSVQVTSVAPAATTTTTLSVQAVRRTVTLRAVVATTAAGVPGGSVRFSQDGVVVDTVALTAGVATSTRSEVAAGRRVFTATYVPADPTTYSASTSAPGALDVQRTVTSTSLTGGVNGSTLTLDIRVSGSDGIVPTGEVRVLAGTTQVGTVRLADGRGTLVLSGQETGQRGYRAVFDGSADLDGSASTTVELAVAAPVVPTPPPTTAPVSASRTTVKAPRTARAGTRPLVRVKVVRGSSAASGRVVVTVGKKSKTLTLKRGTVTLKLARVRAGKVKITVRYLGDSTTTPSTASRTIKVRA